MNPRRTPAKWKKALLIVPGIVLGSLLAEGAMRVFLMAPVRFPRRVVASPWGLRYNEPGSTYAHHSADGDWTFRINHQGMRADRDYARTKPANVRRVVALGDSFTIGYEVDFEQTFCQLLEKQLGARHGPVEVLDAGVSGFSTAEEDLYLERELIHYEPDVVLLCFFANDLVDNTRADLFRLDGDELKESRATYVPLGGFGDFLNRSSLFNALSEHSYAFATCKELVTGALKRSTVEENEAQLKLAPTDPAASGNAQRTSAPVDPLVTYQRRLEAAICERLHAFLRERNVPLVLVSIPVQAGGPEKELVDYFPCDLFALERPLFAYVSLATILRPFVGKELLYRQHSHGHFSPFSHARTAEAIADSIERHDFLR